MSTAARVPETRDLTGDDAWDTLRTHGIRPLLRDAFVRMRAADGFSHARSLAFMTILVVVQGLIALVGLASALGESGFGGVIVRTFRGVFPGPANNVLTTAVEQAHVAGSANRVLAIVLGFAGALISATTLLGQVERACNRIYGIEQDRPSLQKYGYAFVLAVVSGVLMTVAFVTLALGASIESAVQRDTVEDAWELVRWPLGIVVLTLAMALLLEWSPRRRQPGLSWLAFGAAVSVVGWTLFTVLLGLVFDLTGTFGETYGPLAGLVALLLWSLLSAMAVIYGIAVAAQLEAVRTGVPGPRDTSKDRRAPQSSPAARRRAKRARKAAHRDGRSGGSSTKGFSTTSRSVV